MARFGHKMWLFIAGAIVVTAMALVMSNEAVLAYFSRATGGGPTNNAGRMVHQPYHVGADKGLIRYWNLDGNIDEVTGQGGTGTINGATLAGGKFGQGYSFNGTNNYITLGSVATVRTVSMWVYANALPVSRYRPWDWGADNMFGTDIESTGAVVVYNGTFTSTSASITAGSWQHLVFTRDGTNVRVYINGVLKATVADGGNDNARVFRLGSAGSNQQFWNGSLDEVRLYNRALDVSEIAAIYKGSQPVNCDQTCVGWWKFDESSGTTAADSGGQGNNATLTNGPVVGGSGVFGSSLKFDGANDYAEFGNSSVADFERTQAFSACVWINPAVIGVNQILFSKIDYAGSTYRGWELYANATSGLTFNLISNYFSNNYLRVDVPAIVVAQQWQLACVTYNGNSSETGISLYLNGLKQTHTVFRNSLSATTLSTLKVLVGKRSNNSLFFNGSLDDARIYSRALTPEEIFELYMAGR